jgi:hypothetical protein
MTTIKFNIISSSNNSYDVVFEKNDAGLISVCSCAAGQHGQLCKHRLENLNGDVSSITSKNEHDVAVVSAWLKGTEVEKALKQISVAEECYETAKKNLSSAKKRLSRLLNGYQ